MVEAQSEIKPNIVAEQYQKLQHACHHDEMMEAVAEALVEKEEIASIAKDICGTRIAIFSLLIDLGLVNTKYPADYKSPSLINNNNRLILVKT